MLNFSKVYIYVISIFSNIQSLEVFTFLVNDKKDSNRESYFRQNFYQIWILIINKINQKFVYTLNMC